MRREDSLEKTLMLGKTEGKRRRGRQRTRWLDSITDVMKMNLSKLRETVEDRKAWRALVHGVTKSRTRLNDNNIDCCQEGHSVKACLREFVVQSFSHVQLFETPWTIAHQAFLSSTVFWRLLKVIFVTSVMLSNHLILYHPLLRLPSVFPSIRVFSRESSLCIRWPKYWSFSFRICPSNEQSGLISFRTD